MREIEDIKVGDAMTKGVICVDVEDSVKLTAEVMKKNDISGLLVTKSGDGIGVITERDIIKKVVAEGKKPESTPVKDIMTSPLVTIAPDATIDDAATIMRDKDIRRLFVEDNGKIIGILSEFDIVKIEPALHLIMKEKYEWDISKCQAIIEGRVVGYSEPDFEDIRGED
ncbi:MAG: CBS domain-containing protein [Candidatus Altiarchaeota archaeon]|nr:CBS domain-containing protein [Candidatus Altiarchaeota archaeon]